MVRGRTGSWIATTSNEDLGEHASSGSSKGEDCGEGRAAAGYGGWVGRAVEAGQHARNSSDQEGEHDDQGASEQDHDDVIHDDLQAEVGALT